MAPSRNSNLNHNRNGEAVQTKVNILASCYVVDTSGQSLSGDSHASFSDHAFTTPLPGPAGLSGIPEALGNLPSPPSSPPLAALTSANELAITRKTNRNKRDIDGSRRRSSRKEGAAYHIREECERFFCETMSAVFLGEEETASNGSIVMGANTRSPSDESVDAYSNRGYFDTSKSGQHIGAWMEIWDYAGGCSFRGFVSGHGGHNTLFAFFDASVLGRDLKQGLMALIELAETVFACSEVVICLDRSISEIDSKAFMKNLRWVGFELITLDAWTNGQKITSDKWLLLAMEV